MNELNGLSSLYTNALNQMNGTTGLNQKPDGATEGTEAFSNLFTDALQTLESKQADSTQAVEALVDGSADDLHTVMMKTTEAQLSLEVAVQLRNRGLEAYNEIKNMQF
ncbi:flagellar hook-basal body complex protein FliE [Marinilactibacillus psychrotolerans]|uniref:Flagellar hook-basal body complex protein FliE n=1 Tax=Marinilactibacillus psychrotolerans TaxID=191770 RepID=A0A511GY61_9LACT|nr:flagellar hook-basal body complex protein FliE [Marinilactibacillus psychrotolerans]TLQ09361.1 flagellar hook-basal body complex protein FliE [Marinilactibacillus psychrotolerans]GEL66205.1 flagellar hook-basal body complex protein FliE [Marinilactibacillus psychrotolerans]GEQ35052.1 flagellar hook-basal body protein FliE [Marinilactibacillus psychrotolerans]SDC27429.1 flagellar hook-basal body complex protein FliE [Marinilactibacillus psychrotolerans]